MSLPDYKLSFENYVRNQYPDFYFKSKLELLDIQKLKKFKRDQKKTKQKLDNKNIVINISKN